jgi:very-short-patch-repair endonuclease
MVRLRRQQFLDMKARSEAELLIRRGGGLISRRDHPSLANTMAWLVRHGELVTVLPGTYAPPDSARSVEVLMRAVSLGHPDAVVLGAAAAKASFWPEAPVRTIEVAASTRLASRPGFTFSRRHHIPTELVIERAGVRYTAPALTAIDLATFECTDALDIALRTRAATLGAMYEALRLTPNRSGNQQRLRLLIDSRNEPWSAAERFAHRILRGARITGWRTNFPVFLEGCLYYIDVAFPHLKLAIEIDGRLHEENEDVFESDRWRQNALVAFGWRCCALPGGWSVSILRSSWLRFAGTSLKK